MNRLPSAAFAALVVATVGAFFLTQHLKVQNPFINGLPRADPPAINPVAGRVCVDTAGQRVSFRRTRVGFFLQSHADHVSVYVFNSDDENVATARGSRRLLRTGRYVYFSWNGLESNGAVAPDGTYQLRASLQSQDRTEPVGLVRVITVPPKPVVTSVRAAGTSTRAPAGPAIISPGPAAQDVTIRFRGGDYRNARVEIIRTGGSGRDPVVFSFGANGRLGRAVWNGLIHGVPAPAGTYLVGLELTDQACNVGSFPIVNPPPAGSTPHAGVTVRYLAAEPPLVPVTAGTTAMVLVDSRRRPYRWKLFAAGSPKVIAHGSVDAATAASGAGVALRVRLPARGAGLYAVSIQSGSHHTAVPVAAARAGAGARVLVVLPALTWEGENPVDDTGGGLPNTLAAGDEIDLYRPLAGGLPADYADVVGLMRYLERMRLGFQLTTDVALALGDGPALTGRTGVVLAATPRWLPSALAIRLRAFAAAGGNVVVIGPGALAGTAAISTGGTPVTAGPPVEHAVDPFGARHGALVGHSSALITVLGDRLGIFGTAIAFPGFSSWAPITPPSGAATSEAGVATGAAAIAGFRLGSGAVTEIGLPGFGATLAGNVDAQELVTGLWRRLSR